MFDIKNILEPMTLQEVLALYQNNPHLKIIAGGTDVLISLNHQKYTDVELLSLRKIKGMDEIKLLDDGTISIGAMTSFSQIHRNDIINRYLPILSEASVSMGGPQIRNMATIGGNICNGAVSADSAPSLFTLNATLKLESLNAVRYIPIHEFYEGPGKVKINPSEILTAIEISKDQYLEMYGDYIKFSNRKAMDIAMLSVAVLCKIENNEFKDLRIALGVASPTPIRCSDAEDFAKNKAITNDNIKEISNLTLKSSKARDSWRGSKIYREHLIKVLTERAIKESIKRAGGVVNE